MLIVVLTWAAIGMSVINFGVFVYLALKPGPGRVTQKGVDLGFELRSQGAVSEVTELARSLADLRNSFRKAGPAIGALISSIVYLLIVTLGAGLDKISR